MSAQTAVAKFRSGREPFEIRFMLNSMYRAGTLNYNEYWEALELTMEMQEGGMKKYKMLTDQYIFCGGIKLYRIQALKSFDGVHKGDAGGYIATENNLDQSGNAWVSGNARVYENAYVNGSAIVGGNVRVYGNAYVSSDALITGNVRIYGNATVSGNTKVCENTRVYGDACVNGNALVGGDARIHGNANVSGSALIGGTARISNN